MISAIPAPHKVKRETLKKVVKGNWGEQLIGFAAQDLPSPPDIIANDSRPTGESRQKTMAQIAKVRT